MYCMQPVRTFDLILNRDLLKNLMLNTLSDMHSSGPDRTHHSVASY